jgi:hypothetical protein
MACEDIGFIGVVRACGLHITTETHIVVYIDDISIYPRLTIDLPRIFFKNHLQKDCGRFPYYPTISVEKITSALIWATSPEFALDHPSETSCVSELRDLLQDELPFWRRVSDDMRDYIVQDILSGRG